MRYFRQSLFRKLLMIVIAQQCLIVPSFAENNTIEANVNTLFDAIPNGFSSCTTDKMAAPSKVDFEVTEKLASLGKMGDGVLPVLVANITSDKNSDRFLGGNSFASLCALSIIAKDSLNFNRIYKIIDDFYPNKIYAASYPYELNHKIQLDMIDQLGNITCEYHNKQTHCWLK